MTSTKSIIEFKGIGEDGTCDNCGKSLKHTYHFIIDGEHLVYGSTCYKEVYNCTDKDIKKLDQQNKELIYKEMNETFLIINRLKERVATPQYFEKEEHELYKTSLKEHQTSYQTLYKKYYGY